MVVAHYDLKPQKTHAFNVSGNMLIVYEPFGHLAVGTSFHLCSDLSVSYADLGTELLASLTIMRHIEKFHL